MWGNHVGKSCNCRGPRSFQAIARSQPCSEEDGVGGKAKRGEFLWGEACQPLSKGSVGESVETCGIVALWSSIEKNKTEKMLTV